MGQSGSSGSRGPGELLGDDKLGDIDPVTQEVRDGLLGICQSFLGSPTGGRVPLPMTRHPVISKAIIGAKRLRINQLKHYMNCL